MNSMPLIVALAALVILTILYAIASARANKALQRAREDRNAIFRGCFLRGLAGLLAKMVKADGEIGPGEEAVAFRLFDDMALSPEDVRLCRTEFKAAAENAQSGSYYAALFAPYATLESRALVYEVLWDIAAADGRFDSGENNFLKDLLKGLKLDEAQYQRNADLHAKKFDDPEAVRKAAMAKLGTLTK